MYSCASDYTMAMQTLISFTYHASKHVWKTCMVATLLRKQIEEAIKSKRAVEIEVLRLFRTKVQVKGVPRLADEARLAKQNVISSKA